jgi:O-antigen/teichoic acid export membrane protein
VSVARHTLYNLLGALSPVLITVAVTPLYIAAIGVERYGVLAIFWTLLSSLSFMSFGMAPALTQQLAGMNDLPPKERSDLVWTGLLLSLPGALISGLLVVIIGTVYFQYFAHSDSALNHEVRLALPWFAAAVPATMMGYVLAGALQGRSRFGIMNLLQVGTLALISIVPLTIALTVGHELRGLTFGIAAVSYVALGAQLAICRKIIPLHVPARPKRTTLQQLSAYGRWATATSILVPAVMWVDRFFIGSIKGPAAVTAYVLPYNLVQRLAVFASSLSSAALPRLAASDREEEARLQDRALEALTALLTPLAIAGTALLGPFLTIWVGPKLASAGTTAGVILVFGFWIQGICHAASTVLLARRRPDIITKLLLWYLLPYLALLVFLTDRLGIVGAAITWTARASCDSVLFLFTRPGRKELRLAGVNAVLVLACLLIAVAVPWLDPVFWAGMATLFGASLLANQSFLTEQLRGRGLPLVARFIPRNEIPTNFE